MTVKLSFDTPIFPPCPVRGEGSDGARNVPLVKRTATIGYFSEILI